MLFQILLALLAGFALLVWSADKFIDGAAGTAKHFGMPSLLIGILIVGFGTSAPEILVSTIAALDGNPDLALGNALGSNIINTGLILGVTAFIAPLYVHSKITRRELPLLLIIGFVLGLFLMDRSLQRWEGFLLLAGFFGLIGWSIFHAVKNRDDQLADEYSQELEDKTMSLSQSVIWLILGLVIMVLSSRLLVWGAVNIAMMIGISELIIGLTIVAFGTSLPELAASIIAARKGEHDIALGNVVGSNMFNLLAVVGIAASIAPVPYIAKEVLLRDWMAMMILFSLLLLMAFGIGGRPARINRFEGCILMLVFTTYNAYLVQAVLTSLAG